MDKIISDEEYETALKNKDNQLIMHSVSQRFLGVLDIDEIHRCKLTALWMALQDWNPTGGRKFTSFLYQRTYWECLKSVNKQKKQQLLPLFDTAVLPKPSFYEIISDNMPVELVDMLEKRYVYNMSLREIGALHNCCYETVRKKIKLALEDIKISLSN